MGGPFEGELLGDTKVTFSYVLACDALVHVPLEDLMQARLPAHCKSRDFQGFTVIEQAE